ncbi:meiotic recombination protein SPO11 [Nematocida displodere]|uniref:Meiotic recombination protein SPO11 n=1 Tax=Nematocida displodere TaxID=1805483 RepID=A0A177EDG1_9MICR|nr:meiotic recombination protein SPO11 [Nematocida displodere]
MKKELAKTIKHKSVFISIYGKNSFAEIIYNDIVLLVKDILTAKIKINLSIQILSVYWVILREPTAITTRELFYMTKAVFGTSQRLRNTLTRITHRLQTDLPSLKIVPSLKGLVCGEVILNQAPSPSPSPNQAPTPTLTLSGVSLIPQIAKDTEPLTKASVILVVEKEAIFSRAVHDLPRIERAIGARILLVTGKGYPCTNTLRFLMLFKTLPILGLFDCDPHGLHIFAIYKHGSRSRPLLCVPGIERLGVSFMDVDSTSTLPSTQTQTQTQTPKEQALLKGLAPMLQGSTLEEAQRMLIHQKKLSIEDVLISTSLSSYLISKMIGSVL